VKHILVRFLVLRQENKRLAALGGARAGSATGLGDSFGGTLASQAQDEAPEIRSVEAKAGPVTNRGEEMAPPETIEDVDGQSDTGSLLVLHAKEVSSAVSVTNGQDAEEDEIGGECSHAHGVDERNHGGPQETRPLDGVKGALEVNGDILGDVAAEAAQDREDVDDSADPFELLLFGTELVEGKGAIELIPKSFIIRPSRIMVGVDVQGGGSKPKVDGPLGGRAAEMLERVIGQLLVDGHC